MGEMAEQRRARLLQQRSVARNGRSLTGGVLLSSGLVTRSARPDFPAGPKKSKASAGAEQVYLNKRGEEECGGERKKWTKDLSGECCCGGFVSSLCVHARAGDLNNIHHVSSCFSVAVAQQRDD